MIQWRLETSNGQEKLDEKNALAQSFDDKEDEKDATTDFSKGPVS